MTDSSGCPDVSVGAAERQIREITLGLGEVNGGLPSVSRERMIGWLTSWGREDGLPPPAV